MTRDGEQKAGGVVPDPGAALEGFDPMDLEGDLDLSALDEEAVETLTTDEFENVSQPHLLFDSQQLLGLLKPLRVVIKDRQEVFSKVVVLTPYDGYVEFTYFTGEVRGKTRVPILNTQNVLRETYVIEFKHLLTLAKNSGERVLIKAGENAPEISVLGGAVELENYSIDREVFKHPDLEMKTADMTSHDGVPFHGFINRAMRSMAMATRPEDKRVRVTEGSGFCNFLSALIKFENVSVKDVSFRFLDLQFLNSFLENEPEFYFAQTEENFLFRTRNNIVALPLIDTEDLSNVPEMLREEEFDKSFSVSPPQMYRILSMIKSMVGASAMVKIETEKNQLHIRSTSRTSKPLSFPVAAANADGIKISCPVSSLISASLMMKNESSMKIEVDESNRMRFGMTNMTIVFGSLVG